MAGAKETPRQKMIGMMYLVLTAMLALNISRQVLQAFVVVNDGLVKTNSNFDIKNQSVMQMFDKAYKDDSAKVGKFRNNAYTAQALSDRFCKYLDSLKAGLI